MLKSTIDECFSHRASFISRAPYQLENFLDQLSEPERIWLRYISITIFKTCDCCSWNETVNDNIWTKLFERLPPAPRHVSFELRCGKFQGEVIAKNYKSYQRRWARGGNSNVDERMILRRVAPDVLVKKGVPPVDVLSKIVKRMCPGATTRMTGQRYLELSIPEQGDFWRALQDFEP